MEKNKKYIISKTISSTFEELKIPIHVDHLELLTSNIYQSLIKLDTYVELKCLPGERLKDCICKLLSSDKKSYVEFNGKIFFSDSTTLDSAYNEMMGMTYKEYSEYLEEQEKLRLQRKEEYEKNLSKLIEHYKEQGKGLIDDDKLTEWYELVPIRCKDLYEGFDLKCTLELLRLLKKGCSFENVYIEMMKQGHSGFSRSIVLNLLENLSNEGSRFVQYVRDNY